MNNYHKSNVSAPWLIMMTQSHDPPHHSCCVGPDPVYHLAPLTDSIEKSLDGALDMGVQLLGCH
jgi:hypothetical protein